LWWQFTASACASNGFGIALRTASTTLSHHDLAVDARVALRPVDTANT
jgi:hypothetical protein